MEKKSLKGRLDYVSMIIPLLGVVLLCVLFMLMPAKSSYIIQMIRGFLGNDCGIYYALLGVGIFVCSLYIAFSKYGKIKLGKNTDQPEYSSFNWGVMILLLQWQLISYFIHYVNGLYMLMKSILIN